MVNAPLDEALVQLITKRVIERLAREQPPADDGRLRVPCNISVRHVHLCQEHVEILYGPGHSLEPRNELYQPGQYASKQTVTLVGPRMRCLGEVRVLGPLRPNTQVEVSKTDAIFLGVDPPVKPSGNHEGSVGLIVVGPVGVVHLQRGVILANRHIHLSTATANKFGIQDNRYMKVRVETAKKTLFEDVQVRVHESFVDEMHLDTDDGNACGLSGGELVEILLD
ncbi:MAG: phosphate propanoyltransferase [Candidatus Omnitrophota bacterium]|nr:MAG: phosphate propanoyltransferase [Candidatus Omnitrophota bacterium]